MKCKKIFSSVLVAALLFTLFSVFSLPAAAADITPTSITIPSVTAEVGKTVKVQIKMTGVTAGMDAYLSYDKSRLTLTAMEGITGGGSNSLFDTDENGQSPFRIIYAFGNTLTMSNTTILTLTFTCKATGTASISINKSTLKVYQIGYLVDEKGEFVLDKNGEKTLGPVDAQDLCTLTNGKVTVTKKADPKPDPTPDKIYATKITPSATTVAMTMGKTAKLTYKLTPAKAQDTVRYSSSNTKVVKVDPKTGKLTPVGPGTATITIKGKNKTVKCKVTVYSYVSLRVGKTRAIANSVQTTVDKEGTKPFKIDGRTMIPLRFVGEKMGGKVKYVSDSQPITMTYGTKKVEFRLNSKSITVYSGKNKTVKTIDVASQKRNGRTYIPLRAIGQALGFTVYYQEGTELIVVNTPKMDVSLRNKRLAEAKPYITK